MARAWRPCPKPGCPELLPPGVRYCDGHAREYEQRRGTRQQRGYDAAHQAERKRWLPQVVAGTVTCWRCGDPIRPEQRWDLGHDDADRTRYRGPEHVRCNRAAGGRAAHQ